MGFVFIHKTEIRLCYRSRDRFSRLAAVRNLILKIKPGYMRNLTKK